MSSTPEEGIRRTLAQYAQLCDEGRFAEFGDLFEPDARFHVMGQTQVGRAAIEEWIAASQGPEARGKHAMLSSVIDLADDGRTARAWTDYLFVDQRQRVTSVGRYHDELTASQDGRWRFTLREIVFMGGAPERAHPPPG
jgi:3-phenylpropionate/cinnamic acid dioxygenase small subunit